MNMRRTNTIFIKGRPSLNASKLEKILYKYTTVIIKKTGLQKDLFF